MDRQAGEVETVKGENSKQFYATKLVWARRTKKTGFRVNTESRKNLETQTPTSSA